MYIGIPVSTSLFSFLTNCLRVIACPRTKMSLALCEPEEAVLQAINNHELLIGTYEDKFGNKHLYLEYQDVGIMAPIAGH